MLRSQEIPHVRYLLLAFLAFFAVSAKDFAQDADTEQKLNAVKKDIAKQKQAIEEKNKASSELQTEIKLNDIKISNIAKTLHTTEKAITATNKTLKQLAQKQTQLNRQKKNQESALSSQLRSAYSAGQYDYLKMLLNQQRSNDVQRSLVYYQYLNSARIKEIEQFKATINELIDVEKEQHAQLAQLASLQETQTSNQQQLKTEQGNRKIALASLKQNLLTDQERLEKLRTEEKDLLALLEQIRLAEEARAREKNIELNLTGLSKLKNKLNWPVRGSIKERFGNRKHGSLRWKGVLMSAPVGRTVNTVFQGRVLFADWLKGYGLVTVIDHGDGYMSLYGHNQTLLKQVGDVVETGEPIALVGQSGGQSNSGLYFEIRHNGKAVNPKFWCRG